MLEKIASALQKRAHELFSIVHYEEKIEKDWQTQILKELERFIHAKLAMLKKE